MTLLYNYFKGWSYTKPFYDLYRYNLYFFFFFRLLTLFQVVEASLALLIDISLHWSLFCAAICDSANFIFVESSMLSFQAIRCLPGFLPHGTVPCRIVFERPVLRVTWSYHFSFLRFTVVR